MFSQGSKRKRRGRHVNLTLGASEQARPLIRLAHRQAKPAERSEMTGFLHPWLGELIDNSAKEWEGPLGSWEAQGAGFVQVLRNTLVPPQPSQRQAEGAYEAVQEALGLDTGFIVLRVGDSRHALSAVVPAPVLQLHLDRGKPRHLALAGMLLRVELTVKMDVAGALPEASGVQPAAPCYLLVRSLRVFSRKCGVIGTCRPLGLPSHLRALKEKEKRVADQRQKEQEEQTKQVEQKRQEEQKRQKEQEKQEEQRQLHGTRQQQDGDAAQQKSATMPSKGDGKRREQWRACGSSDAGGRGMPSDGCVGMRSARRAVAA